MSFDEPDRYAADFDWVDVDPGDDEEPEDWDDNWHWYDDPPRPAREEPDCYVCNDAGGRCCEPTRLDILRCRVRSQLQHLWRKLSPRRHQVPVDDPWAPAAPSTPPASSRGFADEPPF
jgi:hypothetical protein